MSRILLITIFFVLTIFFAVFLLIPEYNTYLQLNSELALKSSQLDPQNLYYTQVKSAYQYITNHPEVVQKLNDALPENSDSSKIIFFLQQKALQSGLVVKNVVVSRPTLFAQSQTAKNLRELVFSVNVSGSYESLNKFIIFLEKSDRMFEVTNVSFAYVAPTGQSAINSLNRNVQQSFDFTIQMKTNTY